MGTPVYEKGKVKIVWIEDDVLRIYSHMFDDLNRARAFAAQKHTYVIFELIRQHEMRDFAWKLLPYGKFRLYTWLFRVYAWCRKVALQ